MYEEKAASGIERVFVVRDEAALSAKFVDLANVVSAEEGVIISFYETLMPLADVQNLDKLESVLTSRVLLGWSHLARFVEVLDGVLRTHNEGEK